MREVEDDYEEFVLWKEHHENRRSGPPALTRTPAENATAASHAAQSGVIVEKLIDKAPAWIMMLVAAIIGYVTLNQRVSTLEYQAATSIIDREKLHTELNITRDNVSGIKTDLAEIKATLKDVAERRNK